MAGQSALAKAIAKALAKGQVKKAARLEADAAIRQMLWRNREARIVEQLEGRFPYLPPTPETNPTQAGYTALKARGYTHREARALAMRLNSKAVTEFIQAMDVNTAQPLPKIKIPRLSESPTATAAIPQLTRMQAPDDIRAFLLKQYPNARVGDIVEHEGKLYLRTTALGGTGETPNFLFLQAKAPYFSAFHD